MEVWLPIVFCFVLGIGLLVLVRRQAMPRSGVPGLRGVRVGPAIGSYGIKFFPDRQALAVTLTTTSAEPPRDIALGYARFVVHFCAWQLFYFGNGSAVNDRSHALREALRMALAGEGAAGWELVEWDLYRAPLFRYDGRIYRHGLELAGVLGVDPLAKEESLIRAPALLVAHMLREAPEADVRAASAPQPRIVRAAVGQLVAWHEQYGPAASIDEARSRAAAALAEAEAQHPFH